MFKHILVALDGSSYGERILPYIEDLATQVASRVTLLTVIPSAASLSGAPTDAPSDSQIATHKAYLEPHGAVLRDAGVREVVVEVRSGAPARTIADAARELDADLIAMTTQGLGAETEQGLGGTASKVLVLAPCPVYMVHIERPRPARNLAEENWQDEGGANVG